MLFRSHFGTFGKWRKKAVHFWILTSPNFNGFAQIGYANVRYESCSIMNNRHIYCQEHNLIDIKEFGFKESHRTADHSLIL